MVDAMAKIDRRRERFECLVTSQTETKRVRAKDGPNLAEFGLSWSNHPVQETYDVCIPDPLLCVSLVRRTKITSSWRRADEYFQSILPLPVCLMFLCAKRG